MKMPVVQWGTPIREPSAGGLLREASLYARWCQLCMGLQPDIFELPDLLGTLPGARKILNAVADHRLQAWRYDSVRQALTLTMLCWPSIHASLACPSRSWVQRTSASSHGSSIATTH